MTNSSILTRRRRPAPAKNQDDPEGRYAANPEISPDPAAARLQQLNQVEAALAHAARLLEQAQPEDYIPDYDQSRKQTLQELDKTRRTLDTKIYRLRTCRQVQAAENGAASEPADGAPAAVPLPAAAAVPAAAARPTIPAAEKPLRDCQS